MNTGPANMSKRAVAVLGLVLLFDIAFVALAQAQADAPATGAQVMFPSGPIDSNALVWIAFFNAAGLALVAYFQYRTSVAVNKVGVIAEKTEVNSNSMREALVEATRIVALAEGKEKERIEGDARRDAEEKGREEVREAVAEEKAEEPKA